MHRGGGPAFYPAIEVESYSCLCAGFVEDKEWCRIPHPEIIERAVFKVNLARANHFSREVYLLFANQHRDRFEFRNRVSDETEVPLNFREKSFSPNLSARPKRGLGALVRSAFIRHEPVLLLAQGNAIHFENICG